MKRLLSMALLASCASLGVDDVDAATAYFAGQRLGTSVTGQAVTVCMYRYGQQVIERAIPLSQQCPMTIDVY